MLSRVVLLLVVPAAALVSKKAASLAVDTNNAKVGSKVYGSGTGSKAEAMKAYARAVEEIQQLGYPEVRVQMFIREKPEVKQPASLVETKAKTKSTWWGENEAKAEEDQRLQANIQEAQSNKQLAQLDGLDGTPQDFLKGDADMSVTQSQPVLQLGGVPQGQDGGFVIMQRPPVEEYVIIQQVPKGADGKPLTEAEKAEFSENLSKQREQEQHEVNNMMKGILQGLFSAPRGQPVQSSGNFGFAPASFDMGGGHGPITRTTTVCQDGRCTKTEEFADPSYQAPPSPQIVLVGSPAQPSVNELGDAQAEIDHEEYNANKRSAAEIIEDSPESPEIIEAM